MDEYYEEKMKQIQIICYSNVWVDLGSEIAVQQCIEIECIVIGLSVISL